jgi:hypothetical protein
MTGSSATSVGVEFRLSEVVTSVIEPIAKVVSFSMQKALIWLWPESDCAPRQRLLAPAPVNMERIGKWTAGKHPHSPYEY